MSLVRSKLVSLAIGATGIKIGNEWVACQYPERPPDANVMYHIVPDCHGCMVAQEAAIRRAAGDTRGAPNE